jgi:hypothetical protein
MEAAGAWVHGGNQLELRRELGLPGGPGDEDAAGLEGLAQGLEGAALELGELVQEEHAVVGQRDLAGSRGRAAVTFFY